MVAFCARVNLQSVVQISVFDEVEYKFVAERFNRRNIKLDGECL